jgi:Neuraminidase (sialidase)
LAGLAGDAGHFIAVRTGTTITGSAGFTPRQVTAGSGGTGRFVVTGRDRLGPVVAYTSTDNGATWAQSEGFGVVPSA